MTTILYPTRGGQSSYSNQDMVIAIAKERSAHLIFLYVSSVEFLGTVAGPAHVEVLEDELDHMGEFLLAMAQERAGNAGWNADAEVRRGGFREALADVITKHNVDVVVLGAPGREHAMTTSKFLMKIKDSLVEEFGVEVIVLHDGEVLEHDKPEGETIEDGNMS